MQLHFQKWVHVGIVVQVVEDTPIKCEAPSSNSSTTKKWIQATLLTKIIDVHVTICIHIVIFHM
jgi:hypothetical protein